MALTAEKVVVVADDTFDADAAAAERGDEALSSDGGFEDVGPAAF